MAKVDLPLVVMLMVQLLINAAYSVIAPFYPQIAKSKGGSEFFTGIIFALYPVAAAVVSPFMGSIVSQYGRKKVLVAGVVLCSTSSFIFSSLTALDPLMFKVTSAVLRLMQGISSSAAATATMAIITSNYTEDMELYLGFQQTAGAIGLILGPLLGGALYSFGGFEFLFIAYGCILLGFVPIAVCKIVSDKPFKKQILEVKTLDLLRNVGMVAGGLALIVVFATIGFIEPTLALHLKSFGVPEEVGAAFFVIPAITYTPATVLVNAASKRLGRVPVITGGFFIIGIAMVLLGPWVLIPKHLVWVAFSLVLLGPGLCSCILPCIPEMINIGKQQLSECDPDHVSDEVSGITLFCIYLGEILGTPLAGFSVERIGFPNGSAAFGLMNFSYGVIFVIVFKLQQLSRGNGSNVPLLYEELNVNEQEKELTEIVG